MGNLIRLLLDISLLKPIVRPVTRLLIGLIAIPAFRSVTRLVIPSRRLDDELQKDLEQWFRGALILLVATQNMESALFPWAHPVIQPGRQTVVRQSEDQNPGDAVDVPAAALKVRVRSADQPVPLEVAEAEIGWILLGLRVMLAISVVQMMPDQELFAAIHAVGPRLNITRGSPFWPQIRRQAVPFLKGHACVHLNKSSPVLAILAAIAPGWPGWFCYTAAVCQYLMIGLLTTRSNVLMVLSQLDAQIGRRRNELLREFRLESELMTQNPIGLNTAGLPVDRPARPVVDAAECPVYGSVPDGGPARRADPSA